MKDEPRRGWHVMGRRVQAGRLRALRLAAGLTQRALARKMGVSVNTVHLLETDRRQPSLTMLKKLKRVLAQVPREDDR